MQQGLANAYPPYGISADRQRCLLAEPVGGVTGLSIRFVENWYEEFRDREQD